MTIEQYKKLIEKRTGIPARLLSGTTTEEVVEQARQLIEYRRANGPDYVAASRSSQGPVGVESTRDQFADWFNSVSNGSQGEMITAQAAADQALEALNDTLKYPVVNDGGEADYTPPKPSARDQFVEWFGQSGSSSYDGWV